MGCIDRSKKDENGNRITSVTATNGNPSILFKSLKDVVGSDNRALKLYDELRGQNFKNKFGKNWETDAVVKATDLFYVDENGEPKLRPGDGKYFFKSYTGKDIDLNLQKITESGFPAKLEAKITDIAASFIIDRIAKNPDYFKDTKVVNKYLNKTEQSEKGLLAEDMLLAAFEGVEDIAIVKSYFDIWKNDPSLLKGSLPNTVSLTTLGPVFLKVYDDWVDEVVPNTNNIGKFGWRSLVKERLPDFGVVLKDKVEDIEEIDGEAVRIYGQSSLVTSPESTLSQASKNILSRIKENAEQALYGRPTYLSTSEVYSAIANATVGENSFLRMKHKVQQEAKFKPRLTPIVERLNNLTTQQEATLFSTFRLTYNNFLLFTSKKSTSNIGIKGETITKIETRMINSNQSNIQDKTFNRWRNQASEENFTNPRAAYIEGLDESGNRVFTLKDEKIKKLKTAFDKLGTLTIQRGKLTDSHYQGLADVLWEFGMQYGDTQSETKENIKDYFEKGEIKYVDGKIKEVTGVELYMDLVHNNKDGVIKLKSVLTNPKIFIHDSNVKTIKRLASIMYLFEEQPFGSFISGMGKQFYPINLPTSLSDFRDNVKDSAELIKLIDQRMQDPFFSPGATNSPGASKYDSILLQALVKSEKGSDKYSNAFDIKALDSYKAANESVATSDYDSQSSKISLIVRLNAFANNNNKTYSQIAAPTQADRGTLDFFPFPKISKLGNLAINTSEQEVLEGLIIQDLSRINQARTQIKTAVTSGDISSLKEGYHYKEGTNPLTDDFAKYKGSAFTMTQIFGLQDTVIAEQYNEFLTEKMSDLVVQFVKGEDSFMDSPEGMRFTEELGKKVENIYEALRGFKSDLKVKLKEYSINLIQDVEMPTDSTTKEGQDKFLDDFILNDFVGRIEFTKHLRGGISWAKNTADYYKRMGLLKTPGVMLFIKNEKNKNPDYGMMPTFNETTIADFDFQNPQMANAVADRLRANLIASFLKQGYGEITATTKAIKISDKYRPKSNANPDGVNKTDAQGFISLRMYRGIQMGMGKWDMSLDEQAYKNATKTEGDYAGQFVDNNGNARTIAPLKPYYEDLSLREGTMTMIMNKNSYMVVTPEIAANYPMFKLVLDKLNSGVDVINTRSATKGSKQNVIDVQQEQTLDNATILKMDSTKLRLPQIIPVSKKENINFSIQVRKGLVANLKNDKLYFLPGKPMLGKDLRSLHNSLISENINQDLLSLRKSLGLTGLVKAVSDFGFKSEEHKNAKLNHLKQVKGRLTEVIKEKGLGRNYQRALEIVPNGQFDYRFKIPLAFPNFQAKFEQAIMGMFNKNVIKQSIHGVDLVQIAELGGFAEEFAENNQEELDFYDGINPAQVRIKASTLGFPPGTDIKTIQKNSPELLTLIGYRTPNQGKNSTLSMEVVSFLPESHSKAIMVPGGITVQMGSDFDIDKLSVFLPNHKKVKNKETGEVTWNKITPNYDTKYSKMGKPMRDNAIMDVYQAIMTSDLHIDEVVTPLDDPRLKRLAAELRAVSGQDLNINYNNPLAEIQMEERNKQGAQSTGLWANQLSGRNAAEGGNMTIGKDYTPTMIYNGREVSFEKLGVQKVFNPESGSFDGVYTDTNMNLFLSAAVDAGKSAIQIDINDNMYTIPVAGMMLNAGMPVKDVVYFISQPSIKKAIKHATDNSLGLSGFVKAIDKVLKDFKKQDYISNSFNFQDTFSEVVPMDSALLITDLNADITNEDQGLRQIEYLQNFKMFFFAGRRLQTINKIITPDTIKNINEISALNSWIETENRYLRESDSMAILGADELIARSEIGKPDSIAYTFRSVFDSILASTAQMGFINNRDSFHTFKRGLKEKIGSYGLTAAQHKFIDKSLFLDLMTRSNSPLVKANIVSKDTFKALYTNSKSNIVSRLSKIKNKYAALRTNEFVSNLQPHPSNKYSPYFLIQLDTSFDMSPQAKDRLSNGLLGLLKNPESYANDKTNSEEVTEIKNFGKLLIANQLFTTGFSSGYGTYIDLIHTDILTDKTLLFEDSDSESIVEFFNRESESTKNNDYFTESDEIHNFVRNFGLAKPGGSAFLKSVPYNYIKNTLNSPNYNGSITMGQNAPSIYNDKSQSFVPYFTTTNLETGDAKIFMLTGHQYGAVYEEIQLAGISSKLNEMGILNEDGTSAIHEGGIKYSQRVLDFHQFVGDSYTPTLNSEANPEQQPYKVCKI